MEFVQSKRFKKNMILDGFKYNLAYTSKKGIHRWKCYKKNCTATIFERETLIIERKGIHGDDCSIVYLDQQKLSSSRKQKAVGNISQISQKTTLEETNALAASSNMTMNNVFSLQKNMCEHQQQMSPVNSTSISDVHDAISSFDTMTTLNEEFLLVNDKTSNIIMFSCKSNLEFLCESEIVYVGGTFSYCPSLFTQLFTIHGLVNDEYVPLVFCLLKDKDIKTYEKAFLYVMQKCLDLNLMFSPRLITIDFEISIHRAVLLIWPSIRIVVCRFNLIQNWYRKIQELGLTSEYKVNDWLKNTFGLPFLHPLEVSDCFTFDFMSDIPNDSNYAKYADYLIENFIDESSVFPPYTWASHTTTLKQTTNNCESFHSHFDEKCFKAHRSIFTFIKILKDNVQTDTYIKMNSVDMKVRNVAKHIIIKNNLLNTEKAMERYRKNEISRYKFVKIVSLINYTIF